MKKSVSIILLLVVSLLFFAVIIDAQEAPTNPADNVGEVKEFTDKVQNVSSNLRDADSAKNYLRQEWEKFIIANKYTGGAYKFFTSKTATVILWLLFGEGFALSWAFILTIILWFYARGIISDFLVANFYFRSGVDFLLSILGASLLAHIGPFSAYKFMIYVLGLPINSGISLWIKILTTIAIVLVLAVVKMIVKWYSQRAKKKRQERAEEEVQHEAEVIQEKKKGKAEGKRIAK